MAMVRRTPSPWLREATWPQVHDRRRWGSRIRRRLFVRLLSKVLVVDGGNATMKVTSVSVVDHSDRRPWSVDLLAARPKPSFQLV